MVEDSRLRLVIGSSLYCMSNFLQPESRLGFDLSVTERSLPPSQVFIHSCDQQYWRQPWVNQLAVPESQTLEWSTIRAYTQSQTECTK